ncbi:MAG: hypothetical protein JSV49_12495 [Thermoplasmata archaeon]|nr:MAG: hypothetical protein JSV49_12495 [Thermoplasmata archaeon]
MRKSLHIMVLTLMMLTCFFTMVDYSSENAEAIGQPVVTIRFHEGEEEQIADVRPGEHGTVTFPGTVEARIPAGSNIQDVVVSLVGSTGMNWPIAINPPKVQLDPGGQAAFSVTVSVPPETSYYIQDSLTISGTAQSFPGAGAYRVDPITGTIRIAQFYKFSLECDKPYRQVSPTDQVAFNLRVWNYGNGRDTFTLFIPKLTTLAKDGWNIQLGTYTVEVEEKNQKTVQITINTPVKFNAWINDVTNIEIEVKSEQQEVLEGTAFPKTFPLAVRQRGASAPGFEPIFVIMSFAFITIFLGRGYRNHISTNKRKARRKLRVSKK